MTCYATFVTGEYKACEKVFVVLNMYCKFQVERQRCWFQPVLRYFDVQVCLLWKKMAGNKCDISHTLALFYTRPASELLGIMRPHTPTHCVSQIQ